MGLTILLIAEMLRILENLCYEILEPVRAKFDKPVIINSGFRSLEVNRKLGSSDSSQHTKGQAVDFEIAGKANIQVAYWVEANCDFDQLILEFYKPDDGQAGGFMCRTMKRVLIENKY